MRVNLLIEQTILDNQDDDTCFRKYVRKKGELHASCRVCELVALYEHNVHVQKERSRLKIFIPE